MWHLAAFSSLYRVCKFVQLCNIFSSCFCFPSYEYLLALWSGSPPGQKQAGGESSSSGPSERPSFFSRGFAALVAGGLSTAELIPTKFSRVVVVLTFPLWAGSCWLSVRVGCPVLCRDLMSQLARPQHFPCRRLHGLATRGNCSRCWH
jgi:hypothetical protein